ncbi:MAG: N-acetylmuramoyl-L-alanine amidase [Bacillota bacterium]
MKSFRGGNFSRQTILIFLVGILGLFVIVFFVTTMMESQSPEEFDKQEIKMRTDIKVIVDPGHGGIDSGTHDGRGVLEKDITLEIGLRMRDFLQAQGIPVIMTRETDDDVSDIDGRGRHRRDLQERVEIINQGTVAVSIHVNSSYNPKEKGVVVFYAKDNQEGKTLGEKVLQELALIQHLNNDFPVPRRNLYLLNNAEIPMVLVEVGFISNVEDKKKLQDPSYLKKVAEKLGQAVVKHTN